MPHGFIVSAVIQILSAPSFHFFPALEINPVKPFDE